MKHMKRLLRQSLAGSLLVLTASPALVLADTLGTGDIFIYRVGTGAAALGTTASAVFLDEYSRFGSLVQSIPLDTTGVASLTAVGNATTEGIMSAYQVGTSQAGLVFTGYRKDVGLTSPASDLPTATPRVIATMGLSGLANTSITLSDTTATIRSAASTDGSSLFYVGTSASVRYVGSPGPLTTSVSIDARNSRQVVISGSRLFASNGSTAIAPKVQDYGVLPVGTTVGSSVVSLALPNAVNGISFLDLNPTVAGDDTVYALDTVANLILKYSYDGSAWSANGSLAAGSAANITGYSDVAGAHLYMTSTTKLYELTDASGYNAAIAGTLNTLATAGANTAFRGVSVIPEPSSLGLALMGVAGLFMARSRRS